MHKAMRECPIPVILKENNRKPFSLQVLFTSGMKLSHRTKEKYNQHAGRYNTINIWIGIHSPNHIKLAVLYHEEGHRDWRICQQGIGISGWTWPDELHAFRYCLEKLLAQKRRQSLKWAMLHIELVSNAIRPEYAVHIKACQVLMDEPIWQECKKFLKRKKPEKAAATAQSG